MQRRRFLRRAAAGVAAAGVAAAALPVFGLVSLEQRVAALNVDWRPFAPRGLAFTWDAASGVVTLLNREPRSRVVTGTVLFSEEGPAEVVVRDERGWPIPELKPGDGPAFLGASHA